MLQPSAIYEGKEAMVDTLVQYSIVCQAPHAEPYTIRAYSGTDLSKVVGITQAPIMPPSTYGWIQECGEAFIKVDGQTRAAYADFRPNAVRLRLGTPDENTRVRDERLSQLPPLLVEDGAYCHLLREARDVFVDGYFYACVAMCGISLERFQRDKAKPYGATGKPNISQVQKKLRMNRIVASETLALCKNMAKLRNEYAHGHGRRPSQDALRALAWMHSFINNETSLMRDYVIEDGLLIRKRSAKPGAATA
jgi:hypothetical protein